MRRLPRLLFSTATALSLLLCLTTLYAAHHATKLQAHFSLGPYRFGLRSRPWDQKLELWEGLDPWDMVGSIDPYRRYRGPFDIAFNPRHGDPFGRFALQFPHRLLIITTAILPLLWVSLRLISLCRRRQRNGACPACGYDFRVTPDRCPECGAVPGISN